MATMCFQRAGDTYWERRSKAAGLKVMADLKRTSNPKKANALLKEAGEIFESLGKADSAAQCFFDSGEYKRAARIYLDKCGKPGLERAAECYSLAGCYKRAAEIFESIGKVGSAARCFYYLGEYERAADIYLDKCGERGLERAAKCFSLAGFYEHAANAYARGKFFSECLTMCLKGKLFDIGLEYIKFWKQQAREEYDLALRGKGTDEIELDFLESCAFHYHEVEDNRSKMKLVKDWRKSLRENMISLRRNDACKSLLKKVVVDYMSSKKKLSYGQVGRIAIIILGSSNFNNELYAKLVNNLHCSSPWKVFIKNICQEPKEESLPWYAKLVNNLHCSSPWKVFIKNICQEPKEDIRPDVPICFEVILQFLIDVVRALLYEKNTVVEWIQKSIKDWENILLELIWSDYITEQLPKEFYEALRRLIFVQNSPSINVNLIEEAFKKIGNPLVVASFGIDCSRFICSDAIFFDMKANLCIDEMLRTLFSKPHIHVQSSRGQSEAMVVEAKSYCSAAPSAYDSKEANCSKLVPHTLGLVTDKVQNTGNSKQSSLPMDFDLFWEIIEGLQLLEKEGDQRSLSSEASKIKLDLEKTIGTWTAAWSTYYSNCDDRGALSAEVLHMLDETVQLYAVLDGSEQELRNKISTVAELSRRLQSRRQTVEPILTRLVLEHNSKLARNAILNQLFLEHQTRLAWKAILNQLVLEHHTKLARKLATGDC
ncbi:hypothetical protein ACE6H2_000793 [Prunus campanulata]